MFSSSLYIKKIYKEKKRSLKETQKEILFEEIITFNQQKIKLKNEKKSVVCIIC